MEYDLVGLGGTSEDDDKGISDCRLTAPSTDPGVPVTGRRFVFRRVGLSDSSRNGTGFRLTAKFGDNRAVDLEV